MKSLNEKQKCVQCLVSEKDCHSGTISGCYINCGKDGFKNESFTYNESFFSLAIFNFIFSRMRMSTHIHLGYHESCRDAVEISSLQVDGSQSRCKINLPCDYDSGNPTIRDQMDKIVWQHFTPYIRGKHGTTDLIRDAILIWGYLSFLFANTVVEVVQYQSFADIEASALRSDLTLHLTTFILFRLNDLISGVMDAPLKDVPKDDEDYWLDISAAAGLLYVKLADDFSELQDGRLTPLCGGAMLVNLLKQQIESTIQQLLQALYRHDLGCNKKWATHLEGNLDKIRSNSKTTSLLLTLKRSVQMNLPSSSLSATSFGGEIPPNSPHHQLLSDNCNTEFCTPINDDHWFGINPMLPYVPETELRFFPLETFADQASTALDSFGFTPWNHETGHYDTWRQS